MKPLFDRAFSKLKTLFDAYKMWIFFIALISTNGMQAGFHYSEPEKPIGKPVITKPAEKPTIIKQIIYKTDEVTVKKLIETELQKHYDSSRH